MTTQHLGGARLRTLSAYDCWELLHVQEIARVAWPGARGVALVPVNYTVVDGALWFRTDAGSALARECPGQRVVVEVDHLEPEERSGWSVVVAGTARVVDVEEVPQPVDLDVWPSGQRTVYVEVEAEEVTGRRLFGSARHVDDPTVARPAVGREVT
jgi:hypothetical protein